MNKKIYFTTVLSFLLLSACRPNSEKQMQNKNHTDIKKNRQEPTGFFEFERVKKTGVKDTVTFTLNKKEIVTIELTLPERKSGNIRINQIIAPDGEMDGPFGSHYADTLKIAGKYQVVIAESLMQENPYQGPYTLRITVGNQK